MDILDIAAASEEPQSNIWNPEEFGQVIGGTVVHVGPETTTFGIQNVIDLIHARTSEPWRVFCTATLQSQIDKNHIKEGDVIGIKYFGTELSKTGNLYKKFNIVKEPKNPDSVATDFTDENQSSVS